MCAQILEQEACICSVCPGFAVLHQDMKREMVRTNQITWHLSDKFCTWQSIKEKSTLVLSSTFFQLISDFIVTLSLLSHWLVQPSDGQIVNHLLHLFQVVFDPIKFFPQVVILQIEQPGLIEVS